MMRTMEYEPSRYLNDVGMKLTPEEVEELTAHLHRASTQTCQRRIRMTEAGEIPAGRDLTMAFSSFALA